jgi:hypothetical protein
VPFGDRQGPRVGRLQNGRGAEFGSGAVIGRQEGAAADPPRNVQRLLISSALLRILWSSQSPSAAPDLTPNPVAGCHPRANRRPVIDPIPTVLSQVTAACRVLIASNMCPRASPPRGEVEGDVLECPRLDIQPRRT